jgi:hypothetical protein
MPAIAVSRLSDRLVSPARADGWTQHLVTLLGDAHRWVAHWRGRDYTGQPRFKFDDLSARYDQLVGRATSATSANDVVG